ncbi:hypothetical protein PCCS19_14530 [Paenibacillus sp. CCS19]|uniref:oligosaccharide flippase family protein n=1 Tax=Paenibacillus sp. CCS19 TaxID=3158387 RepID=UPI0025605201|nr:oligosaccharide flippase family protein [Paenibacillus cellulosilyticus]GMK38399.1 hypothetical protein PCCS19_14530 [Paenibacillus cellulosilyticus]
MLESVIGKVLLQVRQPGIARFLRNLGVTFIFKAASLLLTLVVYVMCVRELGVITWGQVALIGSAANIVLIPLTLGLYNGVVKYVPVSSEEESRELMGTALAANLVLSSIGSALLIAAGPFIERLFGLSSASWIGAVALGMCMNLYILTESFLRGQQQFVRLGVYKLIGSLLFLAGTLTGLYMLGVKSMFCYLIPLMVQHLSFFLLTLRSSDLRHMRVTWKALKQLFEYGLFIMLSWLVSTLLFSSDLFMMARFGTDYELGVYSVYQNTIRGLCTILFQDVFAVVFLPMIAGVSKRHVDRIIVKYAIPIYAAIWFAAALFTTLLIVLYGKAFPLDWMYVGLTSAGIAMNMMYLLFTSVISLDGVRAARLAFISLMIPIPLILYLQYALVEGRGMIGGMASVVILNIGLIVVFRLTIRFFYQFQPAPEKGVLSN